MRYLVGSRRATTPQDIRCKLNMPQFPKNIRAQWHNYNGGLYFVTFCTKNREHYFGEISDGKMSLTDVGKFADEQFRNVTEHYPYAEIPLWVVMPDHIHAIVIIDNDKIPYERRIVGFDSVGSRRATTPQEQNQQSNMSPREIANMQGWMSVVIGGIKSSITKYANSNAIPFSWQSRFYDHIIRDSAEMNSIAEYIENNIAQWECDSDEKI